MHLFFDMMWQENTTQVLESNALYVDNMHRLLIDQILLVVNANKIPGKGYLYTQYLSSLSMYNWWCDASIPWYDIS